MLIMMMWRKRRTNTLLKFKASSAGILRGSRLLPGVMNWYGNTRVQQHGRQSVIWQFVTFRNINRFSCMWYTYFDTSPLRRVQFGFSPRGQSIRHRAEKCSNSEVRIGSILVLHSWPSLAVPLRLNVLGVKGSAKLRILEAKTTDHFLSLEDR